MLVNVVDVRRWRRPKATNEGGQRTREVRVAGSNSIDHLLVLGDAVIVNNRRTDESTGFNIGPAHQGTRWPCWRSRVDWPRVRLCRGSRSPRQAERRLGRSSRPSRQRSDNSFAYDHLGATTPSLPSQFRSSLSLRAIQRSRSRPRRIAPIGWRRGEPS